MNSEIVLETKFVGDIKGNFFVPSYQRGYRWGKDEVNRLLNDIYATEGKRNYCLQPVVVRKNGDAYELIDGQQRLTTLHILLSYIKKEYKPKIKLQYTLSYATREKSGEFLANINESQADANIDFYYIFQAYQAINQWFGTKDNDVVAADDLYGYLVKTVKVIWYEVDETEDAIGLFTRLNIGKIPLTSSELVKAMFLSRNSCAGVDKEKQEEISLQWDNIEKELHRDALWYFLTNKNGVRYQTRIDLILDLISGKREDNRDKYFTFFEFDRRRLNEPLEVIWRKIQRTFLTLKDWFEDHELYHKIGYLIASDSKTLREVYDNALNVTKDEFKAKLDDFIKDSIKIEGNYSELSYEKAGDREKISRLLLLFNVESVRRSAEYTQWFPFDKFKAGKGGGVTWSLEHIHAQQSEGLRTQKEWKEWLQLHKPSVEAVSPDSKWLVDQISEAINKEKLEWKEFDTIQQKVIGILSREGNTEYLHSISNLALLTTGDNAALNNSTFDVKRNEIIKMDKNGQYIPFCTRMVFLKYYTPSDYNQLHFWGHADREAYIGAINEVLDSYLQEKIILGKDGE